MQGWILNLSNLISEKWRKSIGIWSQKGIPMFKFSKDLLIQGLVLMAMGSLLRGVPLVVGTHGIWKSCQITRGPCWELWDPLWGLLFPLWMWECSSLLLVGIGTLMDYPGLNTITQVRLFFSKDVLILNEKKNIYIYINPSDTQTFTVLYF